MKWSPGRYRKTVQVPGGAGRSGWGSIIGPFNFFRATRELNHARIEDRRDGWRDRMRWGVSRRPGIRGVWHVAEWSFTT